jgi:hypothetical protein
MGYRSSEGKNIWPELPPQVLLKELITHMIIYGFGNAFRKGLGSMVLCKEGIEHRVVVWEPNNNDISSNWCSFKNMVETLE